MVKTQPVYAEPAENSSKQSLPEFSSVSSLSSNSKNCRNFRASSAKLAESDLQRLIRDQLMLMGFSVFRCNVGSVKTERGTWFSTGLPKGFSDLFAVKNGQVYFIEVKVKPNTPSPEQERFLDDMRALGCRAGVAYTLEGAIEIVEGKT